MNYLEKGQRALSSVDTLVHVVLDDDISWSNPVAFCNKALMRHAETDTAPTCICCIARQLAWANEPEGRFE